MTRITLMAVVCMLTAFAQARADDNDGGRQFRAELNGFNETPSLSTDGEGRLRLEINHNDTAIDFRLSYANMTGNPTVAHIHLGQRHTMGGVIIFFCGGGGKPACPPQPATITGTLDASGVVGPAAQGITAGEFDELLRAIRAGATYANVHTAAFPVGEIRGQIRRVGND